MAQKWTPLLWTNTKPPVLDSRNPLLRKMGTRMFMDTHVREAKQIRYIAPNEAKKNQIALRKRETTTSDESGSIEYE